MNPQLQQRFRFFLEHAGYATPPGRAACALALARAEHVAKDIADATFEWEDDFDQPIEDLLDLRTHSSQPEAVHQDSPTRFPQVQSGSAS
jgi:hypothetical protein